MNSKKVTRVVLDVMLSLMIVFEMLIQFTGEFLHEVVGFAFFATIVAHIALSAKWVKSTARNAKAGKLTARRTALAVVGGLLALTTVVLGVSSVAISGILSSAGFVWPIGTYSLWATVHMVSSYALCAIVVVHLAMHWAFLASAFKVPYNPSRRRAISAGVNTVAAVGVLALGATVAGKMAPQFANAGQGADVGEGASDSGSAGNAIGSGDANGATGSGNVGDSGSASAASGSDDSSRGVSAESGPSGKSRKKGRGTSSGNSASTPDSASGTTPGGSASDSGSGATSGDGASPSSGTSSGVSGICTLCRKQCSLSAPKCNKPYEAGLL